jgi:hypothetical protein
MPALASNAPQNIETAHFFLKGRNPLSPIASVQVGPEFSEIKRAEHFPGNWKRLPQENAPR